MKTTYIISNDSDINEAYKFFSNHEMENPYEAALHELGYKLNHNTDDGNVHEYILLEKETGKPVYKFMEYMYYRACLEALTELGYSCDKEEDFVGIENKIIPFITA